MNRRTFLALPALLLVPLPPKRPAYPWIVRHPECGGIAFRMTHYPAVGSPLSSRFVARPDYTPIPAASIVRCGTCGRQLSTGNLRNWIEPANG